MQNTLPKYFSSAALGFALFIRGASAQNQPSADSTGGNFALEDHYRKGWREASVGTGVLFSPFGPTKDWPTVNFAMLVLQAGYMVTDVHGTSVLRGNFELMPEAFAGGIYESTGRYVAGSKIWMRYNFVPHDWELAPYGQLGLGLMSMDIDHRYDTRDFNFNVALAVGARYFIRPRLSLFGELRYEHFSNGGTGVHNIGINASGPIFGVSWHF
jgi:hypothetical protein